MRGVDSIGRFGSHRAGPPAGRARWLRWAERGLFVAGVVLLTWSAYVVIDSWLFQARESRWLQRVASSRVDPERALQVTRLRGVVGRLEIPRLGFTTVVIDGVERKSLRRAPGRIPGSALPGFRGNLAIAGHRDSHFRVLREIRIGDAIDVLTAYGRFRYEVVGTEVVEPKRLDVLEGGGDAVMTLVTCYPFDYVGKAPLRFIVRAREIERSFFASL